MTKKLTEEEMEQIRREFIEGRGVFFFHYPSFWCKRLLSHIDALETELSKKDKEIDRLKTSLVNFCSAMGR